MHAWLMSESGSGARRHHFKALKVKGGNTLRDDENGDVVVVGRVSRVGFYFCRWGVGKKAPVAAPPHLILGFAG